MSFKVEVQEVVVTEAGNGPRKYKVADVTYTWNGNNRKQRVMSFANPDVFKTLSGINSPVSAEVETTKNAKGYDEWAKITLGSAPVVPAASAAKAVGGKVMGSNYETSEERAKRQLMIVRQSSISNAIDFIKLDAHPVQAADMGTVLGIAQQMVDFVYGTDETLEALDRIPNDIPE